MPIRHRTTASSTAPEAGSAAEDQRPSDGMIVDVNSRSVVSSDIQRRHGATLSSLAASLARVPEPIDAHLVASVQQAIELALDPVRAALLARVLDAAVRMSAALDPAAGARVLANASGRDVLLDLLEAAPPHSAEPPEDPVADARVRGLRKREEILQAEGGTWRAEEVGEHLRISRQAVERRRRHGQLLGLPIGGKSYAYPRWQFDADGVLPGFPAALAALTVPGAWTRAAFFLGENTFLDGARPLDELRRGNLDGVLRAASSFGEQIAA